ncbi:DUF1080 domain-containing protein [Agriterribacter sp.]|uniref:3-keto-disaccharide hydrolase n=1 Tax=Agriterribacter sp. TaxID=2821509 RepID=UPI002CE4F1DC|nr:DUF1080 domain-containing protein [Agriterribacter sp.]HRO48060.1 DUF1080 domain-containing protein [Agriterribacter sp.]HRQ17257.1 DUF1080 domain-containing protein [Agriterribacter sp.]
MKIYIYGLILTMLLYGSCTTQKNTNSRAGKEDWISLFNGKDINDWIVKIHHHETGDNFGNTFHVEDGLIKVRYDQYDSFNNRYGHLYFKQPFSYYHLVVEYRFTGIWRKDAPEYTLKNSGVMLHSQDPRTMPREQDWPISVEMQFLAGLGDGKPRPTGNMCSPGTDVVYNGKIDPRHCINSSSETYEGEQWVRAEAIVLGDSLITHIINGDTVLQYSQPQIGGGVANNYDPKIKIDGKLLSSGFIALQSEGQEIDFRKVELLNLEGCMDPGSKQYRSYFVKDERSACK